MATRPAGGIWDKNCDYIGFWKNIGLTNCKILIFVFDVTSRIRLPSTFNGAEGKSVGLVGQLVLVDGHTAALVLQLGLHVHDLLPVRM